jgi:hypothetical protein
MNTLWHRFAQTLIQVERFELVPAGTYPATIVALKRGTVDSPTSKNKGATKINAQIKLHQGGSVFQNLTIVP